MSSQRPAESLCLLRQAVWTPLAALLLAFFAGRGYSQVEPENDPLLKSPAERIRDLEEANEDLRRRLDDLEKEVRDGQAETESGKEDKEEDDSFFATGIISLGGVELELGGKAEFLLIDSQNENDPVVGSTDNPDPRFEIDRFRLEPRISFSKTISLDSQIDFKPEEGETVLKELTADYNMKRPVWWFDTDLRLGLDDRFVRPSRRTENYPLLGNAFWRRESVQFIWALTFGDRYGPPGYGERPGKSSRASRRVDSAGTEGFRRMAGAEFEAEPETTDGGEVVVVIEKGPFDFLRNPGEVNLFFSVGNGYELDTVAVGEDDASFNDMILDDRNLDGDVSIGELGVGLEYRRSFEWLGELGILGFYYGDELDDDSQEFLQNEQTVFNGLGNPIAGYGLSDSDLSERYGVGLEYFLSAEWFLGKKGIRRNDGLRLNAQWIRALDGRLRRKGWYVQGSYRVSFPEREDADGKEYRGLVAQRYFRSVEPLVRYGEYQVSNVEVAPDLPGLWDREQLLLGMIVEITGEVFFKAEYTFNWEDTGRSAAFSGPANVDNNELLLELLLQF